MNTEGEEMQVSGKKLVSCVQDLPESPSSTRKKWTLKMPKGPHYTDLPCLGGEVLIFGVQTHQVVSVDNLSC